MLCTSNAQLSYYVYAFSTFIIVVKLQLLEKKSMKYCNVYCILKVKLYKSDNSEKVMFLFIQKSEMKSRV